MQHPRRFSENGLVSSGAIKVSASNVLDGHEELPARKRKLSDVDMRPHKKSLLATSLGEGVTLLVGNDAENKDSKFIMHKNILKGTEKGIIRLPEEQPEVIRTFVHWIYVDEYLCLSFKNFDTRGPAGQPAGILVKPYVLGDKYLMPRLCNKVMDALTAYCFTGGGKCPLEILDHACKNTAKDSQLRKYLASTTVEYLHEALHNMDEKLYPELIHDIAMHLMRARRDHKDYEPPLTFCEKYHIHGPEPRTPCKEGERNRGGWILYRY